MQKDCLRLCRCVVVKRHTTFCCVEPAKDLIATGMMSVDDLQCMLHFLSLFLAGWICCPLQDQEEHSAEEAYAGVL